MPRKRGTDGKWYNINEAGTDWKVDPDQSDTPAPAASPSPGYKKGGKMPTQAESGAGFGEAMRKWREAQREPPQAKALEEPKKKKVP